VFVLARSAIWRAPGASYIGQLDGNVTPHAAEGKFAWKL